MSPTFLVFFLLAATPVLTGRIADSRGKPLAGAEVRVHIEDGRTVDGMTDGRGAFRIEIAGRFQLEIRHKGFRSVRSSPIALSGSGDDVYQIEDIRLLPGDSTDVETVLLELEEVEDPEARGDPTIREGLPKSDRLFGLRGGVNVTNVNESWQWLAASGNVFTSSSMSTTVSPTSDFSAELGDTGASDDALPPGDRVFHGNVHYFHRNDALNARNFFDPAGAPIPPFKYHFFGASSGGMIRDRNVLLFRILGASHPSIDHARRPGSESGVPFGQLFIARRPGHRS